MYNGAVQKIGLLSGRTPLHIAVLQGKLDAVEIFLKLGVDPNVKDSNGIPPLHLAAMMDYNEIAVNLLEAGASSDSMDFGQRTPLMIAARHGAKQVVSLLIGRGGGSAVTDMKGQTAFHHAAQQPGVHVFMFFLNAGWDPYQDDDGRHSPLYYALSRPRLATYVYARCLDLTHLMYLQAEDHNLVSLPTRSLRFFLRYAPEPVKTRFLTGRKADGATVLIDAATISNTAAVDTFIKAGAELETRRNTGDTAVLAACQAGRLPSVTYLVRQGAKLEYEHQDRTFNVYLAAHGRPEIIRWLLVERWTEQGKLTSEPLDSGEQVQYQPWSGVRTVMIPLVGEFERPEKSSLLDHAKYLHSVAREGWRILVPLGWDTVAYLVPLAGEV
jgi:ankyrin repeat protein